MMNAEQTTDKIIQSYVIKILASPVFLLALATAIAYSTGYMSYFGYLSFFHIDTGYFPLDFQQVLYKGWFFLYQMPFVLILVLLSGFFVILFLLTYEIVFKSSLEIKSPKFLVKIVERVRRTSNNPAFNKKYPVAVNLAWTLMVVAFLMSAFLFFEAVVFSVSRKDAKNQLTAGSAVISALKNKKITDKEIPANLFTFTIKQGNSYIKKPGFVIQGGTSWVAIYTDNGVEIYPASDISMKNYKPLVAG